VKTSDRATSQVTRSMSFIAKRAALMMPKVFGEDG
jgi:hypothetical protein